MEAEADQLAFTVDKTVGHFSPTTRYRDHAISPELIHRESQPATRAQSEADLRYQHHAWRLEHPLPGDLFSSFAAAVA